MIKAIEHIPAVEGRTPLRWQQILPGSLLAIGGAQLITGVLRVFQLYPLIPNISLVYLLLIVALAIIYGRYAAILASLAATLSFDFFLVPPFFTFTIDRWEEWIALFVFLVVALLTSQLALLGRQRAAESEQRERETRILYEVVRILNMQESLEDQLGVVALSLLRVFRPWGVYASAILRPDAQGTLSVVADAPLEIEDFALSAAEYELASSVVKRGEAAEQQEPGDAVQNITRFLPMKAADRVLAVVCLRIRRPAPWFASLTRMQEEQERNSSRIAFFWTFLEQATALMERAYLRSRTNA